MNLNSVPTKGNLMSTKSSLTLAKQGFELMDKKRNILIREIMDLNEKAKGIQTEIDMTFKEAYSALEKANIELGIKNVETFAFNVTPENDIRIKSRSVMGTEIPLVRLKEELRNPALKNITIPSNEALVKTIENALEEKEREEFTRLKVIKSRVK